MIICAPQVVRDDPAKLAEVLSLLTNSEEEVKALVTRNFEEMSAQIAAGISSGISRNVNKSCFRLMWAESIGNQEAVPAQSFFSAVRTFMEDNLKMAKEDVDAILTPSNSTGLTALLDQDKDGMVSVNVPGIVTVTTCPPVSSIAHCCNTADICGGAERGVTKGRGRVCGGDTALDRKEPSAALQQPPSPVTLHWLHKTAGGCCVSSIVESQPCGVRWGPAGMWPDILSAPGV